MISRILVAVDASPRARGVAETAAEIAQRFGATLIPIRVIQVPPEFPPAAHVVKSDKLREHLEAVALEQVRALFRDDIARLQPPCVRHGQPWQAILDAAEEHDVDLIILGSHGFSPVDYLLGTTAAKVANLAKRSVFVVHDRTRPPLGLSQPFSREDSR